MKSMVDTPHPAYRAMLPAWELVDDLMGGTAAMKAAGTKWLPQEDGERQEVYEGRLARSVLYNGYAKTVMELSRRPFAQPVSLTVEVPEPLDQMAKGVDEEGRSLTRFARDVLMVAINRGLCHILVDYPPNEAANLGQERQMGLRPRFVLIDPKDLISWTAVKAAGGQQELTEIRVKEAAYVPGDDYEVEVRQRVRVIRPYDYELHEKTDKDTWEMIETGPVSLGKIALVTLYVNRTGYMTGAPALMHLADLNLAHYQSQSDHRNNLRFARSGVIFLKGLTPKEMEQDIVWGVNHAVKTTSANADMRIIEHSGSAVQAGENELRHLEEQMSSVSMGPLMVHSWGNETAMGKAIEEGKGTCDLQAWVREEEGVLADAYALAGQWARVTLPEGFGVDIYDDFGLLPRSAQDLDNLQRLRDRGDLSRRTILEAAKLRGLLPENHDIDEELSRIEAEGPDLGMVGREDEDRLPDDEDEAEDRDKAA